MFNKSQEEYLIRRLNRNEVVLFLGAGFSLGAFNLAGESFPTGYSLTKKIYAFLYPDLEFIDDGTKLQDMYQALLNSGKSFKQISEFLNSNLLVKSHPDYYKYLTLPLWFKIYTINIDNLINKIYDRFQGDQSIENIVFPQNEFKERDQLLEKVQAIYLHGKLPCNPDKVIFSRAQYANSAIRLQPLYFNFIQDYSNLPTVFIGTALEEQLFEQYIATRQSISNSTIENRPKSFLVIPSISAVREQNLKTNYNIEVIKGTTEDFMLWIEIKYQQILSKDEVLKKQLPALEKLQNLPRYRDQYSHSVREFAQSFQKVEIRKDLPNKRKDFLLGTTPTWADMYYNLDAPRTLTTELFKNIEIHFDDIEKRIHCKAILGNAGSGKSTVLKRLCVNLVNAGRTVYFSHLERLPHISVFIETLEMLNERVIIAIDNAELNLRELVEIASALNNIKFPPIFILASRSNIFERISNQYKPLINLEQHEMKNLDRDEIVAVIQKLDENNLLGKLKGLTSNQRIIEFENKARKQILVAMREATEGKDFESIMRSEFEDIGNDEGKLLCLCTALTTEAGFTISRQDFTSFSSKPPAEALDILERILKGLILKVGVRDEKLMIRHRMIANFLIESCASSELVKQAYIRVLSSLSSDINSSFRNSRKFELYKQIINHYMVYKRFAKNIEKAREVYESLSDYFRDDYQFWLQFGSLELEGTGGNLELAENYIHQANSLRPNSGIVIRTLANLYYKKSLISSIKIEADTLKEKADEILIPLITNINNTDAYSYHIYGKGSYNWIIQWLKTPELVRNALKGLKKTVNIGCDQYPANKRLYDLNEVIQKAILMTAVNTPQIKYPVLHSEFEK